MSKREDIPIATYRIQLNNNFTFKDVLNIIPYLSQLGISHIYGSPVFKARPGSTHGYDMVDPCEINPDIGKKTEFDSILDTVKQSGMGWIQDFVPNHMAIHKENRFLMDLLENGPDHVPVNYFDINWDHPYEGIRGRLLVPILGDIYGNCLHKGEIRLSYEPDGFKINYYDHQFPVKIETTSFILRQGIRHLKTIPGLSNRNRIKLSGVLYTLNTLDSFTNSEMRKSEIAFVKEILWELYTDDNRIREYIETTVSKFNGSPGDPQSFDLLNNLLSQQLFKLSFWKVACEELNYRRFFTINDLVSVRVEDDQVFKNTHRYLFSLVNERKIEGIRIDHIDGLYDPFTYLKRVRNSAPGTFMIVEKILGYNEKLPSQWPVEGTTGYDFCNYVNQIFCYKENREYFDRIYLDFIGLKINFDLLLAEKKRLIIKKHMAGDIDNLALLIKGVSPSDRMGTDITLYGLRSALVELIASFPVYRSYINDEIFSSSDCSHLQEAISAARKRNPSLTFEFNFIERFLLLKYDPHISGDQKKEWLNVVMRFQQFTGPLMAKGLEDTVLYDYNRLISLNEVGGWPQVFGIGLSDFHAFNHDRNELWPCTLNATSTHDSKRGEDARARLNVLSQIPGLWEQKIKKWSEINSRWKTVNGESQIPDRNDEYFLYQTIIGAFPLKNYSEKEFVKRVQEFMLKAVREAKAHTGWIEHDTDYESGLLLFAEKILDPELSKEFFSDFLPFQEKIAFYGFLNSISQCLLKIMSPGIPDFYQGTELWDFSLVDPDNRRDVDYKKREMFLKQIRSIQSQEQKEYVKELLENWQDGRVKMFLTFRGLKARNENRDLFKNGQYIALNTKGKYGDNLVAFARKKEEKWIIAIVPRFMVFSIDQNQLPTGKEVWGNTALENPCTECVVWENVLTREKISATSHFSVRDLFETFPAAILIPQSGN